MTASVVEACTELVIFTDIVEHGSGGWDSEVDVGIGEFAVEAMAGDEAELDA